LSGIIALANREVQEEFSEKEQKPKAVRLLHEGVIYMLSMYEVSIAKVILQAQDILCGK